MDVPEYLQVVVEEAKEFREREGISPAEAAVEVAYRHDELTSPLRGNERKDNLEVLQDLRDCHGICADELDVYRQDSGNYGEATVEALVRRSLEEFIHDRLTTGDYEHADAGVEFAPGVERNEEIGDVWQYDGEEVFIPIADAEEHGE